MNAAEAVERAAATGRWMVAAWRIDDAGTMHLDRVWMGFPEDRKEEAVDLLRSDVAKVAGGSPRPSQGLLDREWEASLSKFLSESFASREVIDVPAAPKGDDQ